MVIYLLFIAMHPVCGAMDDTSEMPNIYFEVEK